MEFAYPQLPGLCLYSQKPSLHFHSLFYRWGNSELSHQAQWLVQGHIATTLNRARTKPGPTSTGLAYLFGWLSSAWKVIWCLILLFQKKEKHLFSFCVTIAFSPFCTAATHPKRRRAENTVHCMQGLFPQASACHILLSRLGLILGQEVSVISEKWNSFYKTTNCFQILTNKSRNVYLSPALTSHNELFSL